MAKRNEPAQPSKLPVSISAERGVKLLSDQLRQIDKLQQLGRKNPEIDPWQERTISVLTLIFGDPSVELSRFKRIRLSPMMYYSGQPESDFQEAHLSGLADAKSVKICRKYAIAGSESTTSAIRQNRTHSSNSEPLSPLARITT